MTISGLSPAAVRRASPAPATLAARYDVVRAQTEALCAPLEVEDYVVSSMPDVSPTKWHLAHTSWFFETFALAPHRAGYEALDPRYAFLFNSYYVQAGERHCRAQRGLVTRPTVADVYAYRVHVDTHVRALLDEIDDDPAHPAHAVLELGLHHEQQHQELLLTDVKHVFWTNPMRPAYRTRDAAAHAAVPELRWAHVPEGVRWIGRPSASLRSASGQAHEEGFAFDNEGPAHRTFVHAFALASRLVTNAEYVAFIDDGGYRKPALWLSNGWATVREREWKAPLYWERASDGAWTEFTLAGTRALDPSAPVCHVSFYEADAFARWAGARLPTEAEWETVGLEHPIDGAFVESGLFHPPSLASHAPLSQLYGSAWQWTASPYVGYPGYAPPPGAIGEYNGKFMSDQWVLRGASIATPRSHARRTYRNFFPSDARWQFSGIRLARHA